jgi:hypothetical protein
MYTSSYRQWRGRWTLMQTDTENEMGLEVEVETEMEACFDGR